MTATERAAARRRRRTRCAPRRTTRCRGPRRRASALVAVGGYGRAELAPHSDLDVVLVSDEGVEPRRRRPSRSGTRSGTPARKLDHSVRTLAEMVGRGRRRPAGRARPARPAPPRRRPDLTLRLRDRRAGALAPRAPATGCPALRRAGPRAATSCRRAGPPLGARPQGGRGRAAGRDRAQGAGRHLARRRPARGPRARAGRRCSTSATCVQERGRARPPTGSPRRCGATSPPALGLPDARAAQLHVRELGRRITHLSRLTWRRVDAVLARPASVQGARRPLADPARPRASRCRPARWCSTGRRRPADDAVLLLRACAAAAEHDARARAADGRAAGARVPAAAGAVARARRASSWCGCSASGRGPAPRLGDPGGDRRAGRGSCPSGSGSGCCRTHRRSTASPSTGTSSRPASRPPR